MRLIYDMKNFQTNLFLGLLASCILLAEGWLRPACAEWKVWTVKETRHILRSEPPGTNLAVRLAGARNEWESFQIVMLSDTPVPGIKISPGFLNGPLDQSYIAWARLYREHQLFLETGTYRNTGFKPDWYPDALIPDGHPTPDKKLEDAQFKAMPFDLPANETHAFFVDVFTHKILEGEFRGSIRVSSANGQTVGIPITLTVWDFKLPEVPTLETEFGDPAGQLRRYYSKQKIPAPSDWGAVEEQCAQLLSEHRFNAVPPREMLRPVAQGDGSYRIPAEQVKALGKYVERYHVNALQIPHPSSAVKDPELERGKLRAWLAAFDQAAKELNRPHLVFYTYLKDEPNTLDDYRYVQKWGKAIREAKPVVKVLVVEQTWTAPGQGGADSAWGDLYGAVDIWCPLFSLHRQDSAAQRQALGEKIWTYTALCQGQPTPWWHTDFPLLNYRVPAWIAWRYRMCGLLYWGGMSYWKVDDPWKEAPYYTGNDNLQQGRKGLIFNGEGSLVYPAHAVGYDGIVPTNRLKALRDAIEDYEYLAILERAGKAAEAEAIIKPLAESFFTWEKNPAAYEAARAQLAALIVGK